MKRIQEVTEILQVRESKLIDVSRMNMELHEQNIHMKKSVLHCRDGQCRLYILFLYFFDLFFTDSWMQ